MQSLIAPSQIGRHHLLRLRADADLYTRTNLRIRTKPPDGRLVPLVPNTAQRYLEARVEAQKVTTGRIRCIVLKARQEGISTWVARRIYRGCTLWMRRRGMVIADDLDRAGEIFGIYERFDEHNPIRPPKLVSRKARELAWSIDSKLTVETAADRNVGRGSTLDFVHASEFALWPYPEETLAGLLDAVPSGAGEVWIESTAQGVGNSFHARWEAAVAGESERLLTVLPWWVDEGYRLDLDEQARLGPVETSDEV